MTTIVIADDHAVMRTGLRTLLQSEPDFRLVGEAADGWSALELVARESPDVLVLDITMPGPGGLEVARRASAAGTRVVMLSVHNGEAYVLEALRQGAMAYVPKDADADELLRAIRAAAQDRRYLAYPLSERAIEVYARAAEGSRLDPYDTLTNREREVLLLAAEGCTNPEIGSRLGISPRTAETHRTNLLRKLGLRNQTDLIRFMALRETIASPP